MRVDAVVVKVGVTVVLQCSVPGCCQLHAD